MATFDADKLEAMKRPELQKLCKSVGIKANSKTVQLIEALKEYAKNVTEEVDSQGSSDHKNKGKNGCFVELEKSVEISQATTITTATTTANGDMNDTYKQELMEHLEKKVDEKMPTESKIPRFVQFIDKSSNKWDSIHKSQFEKMDSIDVYLEKKRKRMESLSHSVKRAKTAINVSKSCGVSNNTSALKKTPTRKSLGVTRKSKGGTVEKAFNPSNSKSTTFSFVFGSPMAKPVFHDQATSRKSAVTAPATLSPTSGKKLQDKSHIPGNLTRKSIATTPFRFLPANVPTVPTPKRKFDLKASLAKSLPYKPYTGKVKNHTEYKEKFKPAITEAKLKNHKVEWKTAKVTTREQRRLKTIEKRENRKENAVGKRRGLIH